MKYVNLVTDGINHEVGAMALNGVVSAVTGTKTVEEDIRQDKRGVRRLKEAEPRLAFVHELNGNILFVNRSVADYCGLTVENIQTEDLLPRLFHPDDAERVREVFENEVESVAPFELELRLRRHDGQYRWFSLLYDPLLDVRKHVSQWHVSGTPIEDRTQGHGEVQKTRFTFHKELDNSSIFDAIIGSSVALRKVLAQASRVASTDSTVLILGETGTGKELIARAIHKLSHRSSQMFVGFNCAAVAPALVSTELFGHEKGAFTGALQRRLGRFELADGGTIFLDEIGDLPTETQIALLRVLQERQIERVGGNRPIAVDVRVIAAANRDLEKAMAIGMLRRDLFYRLNVFPLQVPPLRERVEDIPILAEHFMERYAKACGKKIRHLPRTTEELLQAYHWPGNVRELQNVIERAVVLCDSDTLFIEESWFMRQEHQLSGLTTFPIATLAEYERETIEAALASCRGQVAGSSGAAAKLGLPRQTLESKIKALRIDKNRFKIRHAG
jgi:formate hydrogenlyase transcriptional activator